MQFFLCIFICWIIVFNIKTAMFDVRRCIDVRSLRLSVLKSFITDAYTNNALKKKIINKLMESIQYFFECTKTMLSTVKTYKLK